MRTIALGSRTTTGVGTAVAPFDKFVLDDSKVGVFQATFTNTGTAKLEGRLSGASTYTEIASITSADTSQAKVVALMPDMRLSVTAVSGTVTGFLGV